MKRSRGELGSDSDDSIDGSSRHQHSKSLVAKDASVSNKDGKLSHRELQTSTRSKSVTLPNEIVITILEHINTQDLMSCIAVCRQWRIIVKRKPRLWLRHLELKGCLRQMNKVWQVILKLQRGAPLNISSLKITYVDPADESSDRNPDYATDDSDRCIEESNIRPHWERGLLKTFPIATLQYLNYSGRDKYIDRHTWQALKDCKSLKSLHFRSRRKERHSDSGEYFEALSGSILQCPLETLEIDVEVGVDFEKFNFNCIKSLAIKTMLYAEQVEVCIRKAAQSVVQLQVSSTYLPKIPYALIMNIHDDQCEDEERQFECYCWTREQEAHRQMLDARQSLVMPQLTSFKAIANSPVDLIEREEERGEYGTTRFEYHLLAPSLTEMVYIGYLGWDRILFESCHANLKVVHFDIYLANAIVIYNSISRLSACEKLTLRTRSSLKKMEEPLPKHPFGLDLDNEQGIVGRSLVLLKDLTIEGDEMITPDGLLRFVEYKKATTGCLEVEQLSIQHCSNITPSDADQVKSLVTSFDYSASEEVCNDSDDDAESCYSYSSVQKPFL